MTTSATVHMHDDPIEATVQRSLYGDVSISIGTALTVFCKPEQAMQFAADVLQGVLSLPPEEKTAPAEQSAEQPF